MDPVSSQTRVEQFLVELWLPYVKSTVRATTYYSYCGIARTHIVPTMGRELLCDVSPQLLNSFYATLLASGHTRRSGGLAPSSVTRIHATVHRAFRDAVRWGHLTENPADRADPPKQRMHSFDMNTWTASESGSAPHTKCGASSSACFFRSLLTTGKGPPCRLPGLAHPLSHQVQKDRSRPGVGNASPDRITRSSRIPMQAILWR
jgi:hypothetical protein